MPVLELAPGNENKWIVGVGLFIRRDDVSRDKFCAACRGREINRKHDRLARIVVARTRVSNRRFTLQSLPGNTRHRVHCHTHLVVDRFYAALGTGVIPLHAQALGERLDNPQILSGIPGQIKRATSELHHAIGVGDGTHFLGPRGCGQNNIGQISRFCEEDILHHQHFQFRQTSTCVIGIRIRHGRVFAHHIHALDFAIVGGVHDFNYRQARFGVELRIPQFFEARKRIRIVNAFVIREHHRDQARV